MDQAADSKFLTLTDGCFLDGHFYNEMKRELISILANHGRKGIIIFCDIAENEYNSRAVTALLIKLQLEQNTVYNVNRAEDKYS